MLDDATRQAYDAALEQTHGDKIAAAEVLGLPIGVFRQKYYNCPELRSKWSKARKDAPAVVNAALVRQDLIPAGQTPVDPLQTPEAIESLAVAADEAIARGLNKVPVSILTADEQELAKSLHGFQLRHAAAAAEVVGGSISLTTIKLTKTLNDMIADLAHRIDAGESPEKGMGGSANATSLILEAIPKFTAELRKMGEVVDKARVARAMLDLKKKQDAGSGKPKGRPGFSPLLNPANPRPLIAVNVQSGGTVKLGESNGQEEANG